MNEETIDSVKVTDDTIEVMVAESQMDKLHIKEQDRWLSKYRIALADAIRRPMGVFPMSSEGLITEDEVDEAEKRRANSTKSIK